MLAKTYTFPPTGDQLTVSAITAWVIAKSLRSTAKTQLPDQPPLEHITVREEEVLRLRQMLIDNGVDPGPAKKFPAVQSAEAQAIAIEESVELTRLVLKKWVSKETGMPHDLSDPEKARELIGDEPGLIPFVQNRAKELGDEATKASEADAGN